MPMPNRKLVTKVVPAYPRHKFMVGRNGRIIKYVVIHTTDAKSLSSTVDWFGRHPDAKVSSHYLIGEKGELIQFVDEKDTAYHAGNLEVNLSSIGIEHVGLTGGNFEATQIDKSAQLTAQLCLAYKIPLANVIPHNSVKGTTHMGCPGPTFPWTTYRTLIKKYMGVK